MEFPPPKYLQKRINNTESAVEALDVDGLLISSPVQKGYLSGFTSGVNIAPGGYILMTGSHQPNHYITGGTDYQDCKEALEPVGYSVTPYYYPKGENVNTETARLIETLGFQRIAVEERHVTLRQLKDLQEVLKEKGAEIIPVSDQVNPLREKKDAWEMEQLKKANQIAAAAFLSVLEEVRPGVTEWDLAISLDMKMREKGFGTNRIGFQTIVVSGPRSSLPHGAVTRRPVQKGDLVTIDFGATWNGYTCDITRTFVVGEASHRQREVYQTVLEAQSLAKEFMSPSFQRNQCAQEAEKFIQERGLGEYMAHGAGGHGIGLEVHEAPDTFSEENWEEGNVVTIEPGIYIPDWGGVRIEDDVIITQRGPEIITPLSRDLLEI